MPAISTCPKCQQQVSIPAGVDSSAAVRCPLCKAEYPLSEALLLAPPELIPVVAVAAPEVAEELIEPPLEVNEAVAVAQQMPMAATAPLRRRKTSWLGRAIGLIVCGLAGCIVGLYALAFILGPQYRATGLPERVHIGCWCDFPLPLIHRLTTPAKKPNKATGTPAAEKPQKPVQ